MADTEALQKHIRNLLAMPISVKPSPAVSTTIANLKDLCELQGTVRNEWRGGGGGSPARFHTSSSTESFHGNRKMNFRSAPDTPIARTSSAKSLASDSNQGSPMSPPPPVAKYQSKFKNSAQPVEDKILNNIILSKLNKFSPQTYNEIREFLYQILGSGEPDLQEMIRHFMTLVFKKAAIEEIFCPLYARLLCEISSRYSVILPEMQALQLNYLAIFDDIQEGSGSDYNTFVESQKDKQYRRGYSQFLAELTALEILDFELLNTTFKRILGNMLKFGKEPEKKTLLEEYADCLFRMSKVLKKKQTLFFIRARSALLKSNEAELTDLVNNYGDYVSESAKTRFVLMDVIDILKGV